MAYDFGAQSLGVPNPFKTEGKIRLVTGILIALLALWPLLTVASTLKENPVRAWGQVFLGLFLLTWGLRIIATSAMQLFRFYVGRSVPASLAYNLADSERENAQQEKKTNSLAYNAERLESMLMGRKNTTFTEPTGWLARLVHSVIPKLILAPYPLRNFAQELAALLSSTLVALIAFGVASFVVATGLAGAAGDLIRPLLSLALLLYLVVIWRSTAANMQANRNQQLQQKTIGGLSALIVFSLVAPVVIGYGYSWVLRTANLRDIAEVQVAVSSLLAFGAWGNLLLMLGLIGMVVALAFVLIRERLALAGTQTAVSEYRANMQESVHPNEIFINIENIVLANRRYRDIPNRVYRNFEPKLEVQAQDKGKFFGKLLIETQPAYRPIAYSPMFTKVRLLSTIGGQVLTLMGALLLVWLFHKGFTARAGISQLAFSKTTMLADFAVIGGLSSGFLTLFFAWLTVSFSGRILANLSHLMWAEIQFDSLLMGMKTEGTYTESKISTGMAFNDSTRSENTVVRSSITPWILTSRIVSSTYATSGMMNLEMPRLVMEMHDNPQELESIVVEIKDFLRGREYIASIDNEKDLSNAERIYQVNRISRSDSPEGIAALADHSKTEVAGIISQATTD